MPLPPKSSQQEYQEVLQVLCALLSNPSVVTSISKLTDKQKLDDLIGAAGQDLIGIAGFIVQKTHDWVDAGHSYYHVDDKDKEN